MGRLFFLLLFACSPLVGQQVHIYEAEERNDRYHDRVRQHRSMEGEAEVYERLSSTYEQRARHSAIQLREFESAELRDFGERRTEQDLLREREREARARRVATLKSQTRRERQMQRMMERSWHDIPHNGESSPRKPQYIYPYKQNPRFRRGY